MSLSSIKTYPIAFENGIWSREGDRMVVEFKASFSEYAPGFFDLWPKGFEYDISTLIKPRWTHGVYSAVVKGWADKVELFKTDYDAAYKITGSLTLTAPGTYTISGNKVTLNSGSVTIGVDATMGKDGKIELDVVFEDKDV